MENISISIFKAQCLRILEEVHRQRKRIVVTKRGKPIVEVRSIEDIEQQKIPLKETVVSIGDIISPVCSDEWEVLK